MESITIKRTIIYFANVFRRPKMFFVFITAIFLLMCAMLRTSSVFLGVTHFDQRPSEQLSANSKASGNWRDPVQQGGAGGEGGGGGGGARMRIEKNHPTPLPFSKPTNLSLSSSTLKVKSIYERFLEKPIINKHNFSYLINQADTCLGKSIHLMITTPSAPANFFRRMKARKALEKTLRGSSVIRRYFFLGATKDKGIQAKIGLESQLFKDIVQESYMDVYKNITHKAVQMLKWVSEFCPNAKYVLRLDDDVEGTITKLVAAMMKASETHEHFVMGNVKTGWPPCKIPKCRTSKKEYPHATLPPFALGGALGYPATSVIRLYEASKRVKWFKLDDVYVTGMCAPLVQVKLLSDPAFDFNHGAW